MNLKTLELTNLKLEKEHTSSFPVLVQFVQNTTKTKDDNVYYGTIGDQNLAYAIEMPGGNECAANSNFNTIRSALVKLKSLKLSRSEMFNKFHIIKITDYSYNSLSLGSYDFVPMVYKKVDDVYRKLAQSTIGILKVYMSKEAFILIDKKAFPRVDNDKFNISSTDDFLIDICFKRHINNKDYAITSTYVSDDNNGDYIECKIKTLFNKISDLRQIRCIYDGKLLDNSYVFSKFEIETDNEIISKQLSKKDYFKFLYHFNYDINRSTEFTNYNEKTDPEYIEFTIKYYPCIKIKKEDRIKFNIEIGDEIKSYYISKGRSLSIDNRCMCFKIDNGNNFVYFATNKINDANYEVFPAYDDYETFIAKINYGPSEDPFDIHKVLKTQDIYNYDVDGFIEYFDMSGNKLTTVIKEEDIIVRYKFNNYYDPGKTTTNVEGYSRDVCEIEPLLGIYNKEFNKDVDIVGNPLSVFTTQPTDVELVYPYNGNDARIEEILYDDEVRYYNNEDGKTYVGFRNENLSELVDNVAYNKVKNKLTTAWNNFEEKDINLDDIREILLKQTPNSSETSVNDGIIEIDHAFSYIAFYGTGEINLMISLPDQNGEYQCYNYELHCEMEAGKPYIHVPYYFMSNTDNKLFDHDKFKSGRVKIEVFANIECTTRRSCNYYIG